MLGVWATCAALTVACGGGRTADNNSNTTTNTSAAEALRGNASERPAPVDVSGCLTASGDRFVLTSLQTAAPRGDATRGADAAASAVPTTETYQLIAANTDDLRKYVGQQVRVSGEADPARVAQVRELSPATPAQPQGTSGTQANAQPSVRTEESTRIEARKLRVSSVTAAGGACPTAPAQSR
jgi:hypothetical protein